MTDNQLSSRRNAIAVSVAVGLVMLVTKVAAFSITGSAAILSDALESVVHVVATIFAFYSVITSARPPDRLHPYGHGKIEFFAAGFEGALIIVAALAILYQSGTRLVSGTPPKQLVTGILLTAAAGVTNLLLGWYLIRAGRRLGSLTIAADGRHVLTDSYTSFGVVLGLVLVRTTGWVPLDPIVAIVVAGNILVTGVRLVRESIGGLLDEADQDMLRKIVITIKSARRPEWIDVHHLRSWRSGERPIVDLHLCIPRFWEIPQGHVAEKEIEEAILAGLDADGEVIVHLDACLDECCVFCQVTDCPVRSEATRIEHPWSLEQALGEPAHNTLTSGRADG